MDRFADNVNKKMKRFNSKYFCPGTNDVNAFTKDWSVDNNWLCPPVSLVGATIRHFRLGKGRGTLLVPMSQRSYYWPRIYPNGI